MKNCYFIYCFLVFNSLAISAKELTSPTDSLPKVFMIGEYDKGYEKLNLSFDEVLLSVCNNDMNEAYEKWVSMLVEMESYSDQIKFDIKGIKIWINVFFEKDGSIKHIAYHLKPNSRNVSTSELTAFLSSFMNHYKMNIKTDSKYSHYGSAAFPTFGKRVTTAKSN